MQAASTIGPVFQQQPNTSLVDATMPTVIEEVVAPTRATPNSSAATPWPSDIAEASPHSFSAPMNEREKRILMNFDSFHRSKILLAIRALSQYQVSWRDDGVVVYKGRPIPFSSIVKLLDYIVVRRTNKSVPTTFHLLKSNGVFADANVWAGIAAKKLDPA